MTLGVPGRLQLIGQRKGQPFHVRLHLYRLLKRRIALLRRRVLVNNINALVNSEIKIQDMSFSEIRQLGPDGPPILIS